MEKFDFYDFEKIALRCSSSCSLFDFVALHSVLKPREFLFLRLKRFFAAEGIGFDFVVYVVSGKLKNSTDYARLLRFLFVYWSVIDKEKLSLLQCFNEYYHCDLNMSDFDLKTPECF